MVKRLLKCVREFKKDSILTPVFVSLEVVMEVIIPLLMANLIDLGLGKSDMSAVVKFGIALVISALISMIFGALAGKFAARASTGFAKNLRKDMFLKAQNFSFANIDKFSTASIVTRLTTDVTNIQNAYQMIIRIAVRSPMMLIFSLIMTMGISMKIALIFLISLPLLGVAMYLIIKKAHPIFERVFTKYDKLNNVVQENLHGIRVVKSFVREDYEEKKFKKSSEDIYKDFSKAESIVALNNPIANIIMYGCILLTSWFGAQFIVGGEMTTGQLVSVITYGIQILSSLMMLSMIFVMVIISRASAERITELLEEEIDLKNGENPCYTVQDGSVVFENVSFSYSKSQDKLCLMGVNLDIKSGETVGIIGGTGSAKTSLIQLIARLYDTTIGTVYVGGRDVKEYDIKTLRDQVAVVLQKNVLFSGTIKENLRWGNENATDEELKQACMLAQADSFISDFPDGYDTYIEQGGTNVSGGQKQRICIARALLKKPKILILDDSTSAVDTKTDSLIRHAFQEEIPDTTKFIIAQRITSVKDADKIIVMEDGKIDDVGTHEELLARNEIYQEVYISQQQGGLKDA